MKPIQKTITVLGRKLVYSKDYDRWCNPDPTDSDVNVFLDRSIKRIDICLVDWRGGGFSIGCAFLDDCDERTEFIRALQKAEDNAREWFKGYTDLVLNVIHNSLVSK